MLSVLVWPIALAVVITTALPLTNSVRWWVRMWDFPRPHITLLGLCGIFLAIPFDIQFKFVLIAIMLVCTLYQSAQIFPYTPLARQEIDLVNPTSAANTVSLLSANVLMENTRKGDLIHIIEREDPDVIFLMEIDDIWQCALQDVLSRYSTIRSHPTDDHYGLIFATRLDAIEVDLLWPLGDNTPALKALLKASDSTEFNFIGLHPRPPVPGNDTIARDRQIKHIAKMTSSADRPTICMGDFNDVAWSWTTQRFKRYGGFFEPRVGRGMISSFHTKYWFMRLPIDQLYLTENVGLVAFGRLEDFGSDHFPMKAIITFDQERAP